jgi:hypothetical protein
MDGDLIQKDKTKLGFAENLGLKKDKLAWEFFGSVRKDNIHVLRVRAETSTLYGESKNDSFQKTWNIDVSYDLDFYMSPQVILGSNSGLRLVCVDSKVNNVVVGGKTYNYEERGSGVVPVAGVHGSFYPILTSLALRPSISARVNCWNYKGVETLDAEVGAATDIPINDNWTWSVGGGYRFWHVVLEREKDRVEMNRKGFFIETSLLF